MKARASFLVTMLTTLAACASPPPQASPPQAPPPQAEAPPQAETPPQAEAARPPWTQTIEVNNLCVTGVHVYIGDVPNGTTGDHLVLRGGGTSHFPRTPDGTLVIWIEDERGYGLVKVHVSRKMSHVEIGTSCQTLHAS